MDAPGILAGLVCAFAALVAAWPTAWLVRAQHAQLVGLEPEMSGAVTVPPSTADYRAGIDDDAPVAVVVDPGHSRPYAAWEGRAAAIALVVLWAGIGARFGLGPRTLLVALACWVGAVVVPIDWRLRLIPDLVVFPAILAAIGIRWWIDGTPVTSLIGAATGLVFWGLIWLLGVLIYRSVSAFGLGDVKLGIFVGAVLGLQGALLAFVIGIVVGGFAAIVVILAGLRTRRQPIPYGPFIVAGMLAAILIAVGS